MQFMGDSLLTAPNQPGIIASDSFAVGVKVKLRREFGREVRKTEQKFTRTFHVNNAPRSTS